MKRPSFPFAILCSTFPFVASFAQKTFAQENMYPSNLERITTVPEDDYSPVLSPDGRWLVFVTEASGQGDLVLLDLNDPQRFTRSLLYPHPTIDSSPAFSPDGNALVWSSQRSDIMSDIWAAKFPNGEPKNLGKRIFTEELYSWKKNNDQLEIQIKSRDQESQETIEKYNLTEMLNLPRNTTAVEFPMRYQILYLDDTNGDGLISERSGDWPSLWEQEDGVLIRQITPPLPGLRDVSYAADEIVFSLEIEENRDIYRLKKSFPVTEKSLSASLAKLTVNREPNLNELYLFTAQVRNACIAAPNSEESKTAIVSLLEFLRQRNRSAQALEELQRYKQLINTTIDEDFSRTLNRWAAVLNAERAVGIADEIERTTILQNSLNELNQFLSFATNLNNQTEVKLLQREKALVLLRLNQRQASIQLQQELLSTLEQPSLLRSIVLLDSIPLLIEIDQQQGIRQFEELVNLDQAYLPITRFRLMEQLYDSVGQNTTIVDAKLAAIRQYRSLHTGEYYLLHSYYREAKILASLGRITSTNELLESVQVNPELDLDYQIQLQLAAGEIESGINELEQALERYQKILRVIPLEEWEQERDAYERTKEKYSRQALSRANRSLRLGDNRLAYSQFVAMTESLPTSVEAWRGLIESENRLGLLTSERIREYSDMAKNSDDEGLGSYRYGLALSYPKPTSKKTKRLIEQAIAANSSVPYYYQTLGFINETRGRENKDVQEFVLALNNYQRALGLSSVEQRPLDYARLLQNAGNMAFALDNTARAFEFYNERSILGLPFDDPRAAFLFHRNYGVTAYRSYEQQLAITQFVAAAEQVSIMAKRGFIHEAQAETLHQELIDRQALAELSRQNFEKASTLFQGVAEASDPNSLGQARALRNQGFALFQLARGMKTVQRYQIAGKSITVLQQALDLLNQESLVIPKEESGGFFSVSLQLSSSDQSTARVNLSKEDEKRFVTLILSRLKAEFESPEEARTSLQDQLNLLNSTRVVSAPQDSLALMQTLDELATIEHRSGNKIKALEYLVEGFQNANYTSEVGTVILLDPTYHFLMRVAEVSLSLTDAQLQELPFNLSEQPKQQTPFIVQLDQVIQRFMDAPSFTLALASGELKTERLSLLLQRALIAERQSNSADSVSAAAHAARAFIHANRVLELGSQLGSSAQDKQWMLFAYGINVRIANRFNFQQEEVVAESTDFFTKQGYDDWLWWLTLQQITSTAEAGNVRNLQKLLVDQLGATHATSNSVAFLSAIPLLQASLASYMEYCAAVGDFDELLRTGEILRHAEYRLQFSTLDWQNQSTSPQEQEWLNDFNQYKRQVLQARLALQSRPADSAFTPARDQRLQRSKELLANHLEEGVNSAFPTALRFAPFQFFGDAAATLQDFILSNSRPLLIISLPSTLVLFDASGEPKVYASQQQLLDSLPKAELVYHSDFRLNPREKLPIEHVLESPSLSLTLLALSQTPLRISNEVAEWRNDSTRQQLLQTLSTADAVQVDAPLNVEAQNATFWRLAEKPLETQLTLLQGPREWTYANVTGNPRPFAALLATANTARFETPDSVWLTNLVNPQDAPELAASELDAELARVIRLMNQGQTREALGPLRRVYLLHRALNSTLNEQLESGRLLAQIYRELGQAKDALPIHEELLLSLQGEDNTLERATQLRLYASDANEVRAWEKAATSYQQAIELFSSFGDSDEAFNMLRRAAIVRENQGQVNQALGIMAELLESESISSDLRYQLHSDRGRIYLRRLNRYAQALTEYQEAQRLAQVLGNRELELLSALDVVRVKERLGMISEASDSAASVLEQARAEGLLSNECDALLTLCYLEWTKGQYLKAFNHQEQGQQLAQRIGDDTFQLIALNYEGLIYWALNDLDKALEAYTQALEFAEDQFFEQDLASTLNNRSLVYRSDQDFTQALEDINRAFEIDARWNNDWALAYNLRNRGLTYLEAGDLSLAAQDFRQALVLTQSIGDAVNQAKVHLALGRVLVEQNNIAEAQQQFGFALNQANLVPLPEVIWQAQYGLSQCEKALGNVPSQIEYLLQAINVVDTLRASLKLAEFQEGFLADKQVLYDELVLLRMDQGDWPAAYSVSEQSRGRNFIDLLGNQKVDLLEGADEDDLRREENLRSRIEILQRQQGGDDPTLEQRIAEQLDDTRQEYADFLLALRARNPELSAFVSVEPIQVSQIQALLDSDTAVLQYHVTENELIIFLVSQQSIQAYRQPIARSTLSTQILNLRERLQTAGDINLLQRTLSSQLLQPVAGSLSPFKRLAIIPHRELHLMPFAVLRVNESLLLDSLAIYFSPSASVLRYTMEKKRTTSNQVLAIGNPKLAQDGFNLPMAEKEAQRITWSFPDATVLTGEAATKSWLVENISNYGIIHLAMHGEFRPEAPLLSGLQLAPDELNNGVLTAADIFGLSMNADMVALSACQTGLGRITSGDEIIGLNRSFVYAGTRQVLSSLWRVDDVSTSILIKHFYRNMETMDRAEALRQAQLTTKNQYPHPTYWAGINLSGDWK